MTANILNAMPEGPFKEWYRAQINETALSGIETYALDEGYNPVPERGMFIKPIIRREEQEYLGFSSFRMILTVPSSLHDRATLVHGVPVELVKVLGGSGRYFYSKPGDIRGRIWEMGVRPGMPDIKIQRFQAHAWAPDPDQMLELRVLSLAVLRDKDKVVLVRPQELLEYVRSHAHR